MEICKENYLGFFRAYWDLYALPTKSPNAMVIVEPRQHSDLEFVIKNTTYFCPGWSLWIFASQANEDFVKSILGHNLSRTHIIIFTEDNITIDQYNYLLLNIRFWELIEAERCLIFQTDTIIRRFGINEFLGYDYIGAPWPHRNNRVGNGGLSLRRRAEMISAISNQSRIPGEHEDEFFSRWIYRDGSTSIIPSYETALSFSVENIYHSNSLGAHQLFKWSSYPDLFINLCRIDITVRF